jgi:hypothetical protein
MAYDGNTMNFFLMCTCLLVCYLIMEDGIRVGVVAMENFIYLVGFKSMIHRHKLHEKPKFLVMNLNENICPKCQNM